MATLIVELLKQIEKDDTIIIREQLYDHHHPLVYAVVYLANEYLTADDRHVHMSIVKQSGFGIYPGEQDRFGWLTGCIQLERGRIVFG
jgi:hypothetical protein